MKSKIVADIFYEIADLLEIQGVDFVPRAYRKAAQTIETLGDEIEQFYREQNLQSIPGIGEALEKKIIEIIETGALSYLDKVRDETPESLLTLMNIPNVGPKKALMIYRQMGIETIEELKEACEHNRIRSLPGFGEITERNILKGIEMLHRIKGRFLLGYAHDTGEHLLRYMGALKGLDHKSLAGSLRRMKETIGDIDLLVATSHTPSRIMDHFVEYPRAQEVLVRGATKASLRLTDGTQVDLRVMRPESYGAALQYFTGSKAHNIRLRTMAKEKGLKISEYGVFEKKTGKKIAGETEDDVYKTLGLPYIPPELREDRGEIEAAKTQSLPHLIDPGDITGDLHIHTEWSDGLESIQEMANHAHRRGYQYIGIADHSQSLKIARGLSEEKLKKQQKTINNINKEAPLKIFAGTECDIKPDGSLDFPKKLLQDLDYVCVAIHSHFKMPKKRMTTRIIRALEKEAVTILTHPTGRLIGRRDPLDIDLEKILETARDMGVCMEINAFPDRLDLNDMNAHLAHQQGTRMAIGTDSHRSSHLPYMKYGVATARRGWLEKEDILNTLSLKDLTTYFEGS